MGAKNSFFMTLNKFAIQASPCTEKNIFQDSYLYGDSCSWAI